jgi:hypothetical protein
LSLDWWDEAVFYVRRIEAHIADDMIGTGAYTLFSGRSVTVFIHKLDIDVRHFNDTLANLLNPYKGKVFGRINFCDFQAGFGVRKIRASG